MIPMEVIRELVAAHQPDHVNHVQTPTSDTEAACSCGAALVLPRTDRPPLQLAGNLTWKMTPKRTGVPQ